MPEQISRHPAISGALIFSLNRKTDEAKVNTSSIWPLLALPALLLLPGLRRRERDVA